MKFFKKKIILPPTREALEKSIRNNLRNSQVLQFIFFGFLFIYSMAYVRLQKNEIQILISSGIIALFAVMYFIVHKIDKARLDIYNGTHEE